MLPASQGRFPSDAIFDNPSIPGFISEDEDIENATIEPQNYLERPSERELAAVVQPQDVPLGEQGAEATQFLQASVAQPNPPQAGQVEPNRPVFALPKPLSQLKRTELVQFLNQQNLPTDGTVEVLRRRVREFLASQPRATRADMPDQHWEGFSPGINEAHPGVLPRTTRNTGWEPTEELQHALNINSSPFELFSIAMPPDVLERLVSWTNSYANILKDSAMPAWYRGNSWPSNWVLDISKKPISVHELYQTFGICQLMGVVVLPQVKHYWSKKIPYFNTNLRSVMSRERFVAISSCLVFCDRTQEAALKERYPDSGSYWKIADFFEEFVARLRRMINPGEWVTLDEVVIKSWTQNRLHKRLKFKPAGSGCLLPSLHTVDGLLLGFSFPRKKGPIPRDSNETSEMVKRLLQTLPRGTKVAADNYFNFAKLSQSLYDLGYHIFGTLRPDRIPAGVLRYLNTLKSKEKWSFLSVYRESVYIFGWTDSKLCYFISNLPNVEEASVQRWDRAEHRRRSVGSFYVARKFNECKSGADLNDL
jgi:hypothetical protein